MWSKFMKQWFPILKAKSPTKGVIVHDTDNNMWGSSINIEKTKHDEWRVHGWKNPVICEGDVYSQNMTSGEKVLFKLINVENCRDPGDMFFADAEPIGYWKDLPDFKMVKLEGIRFLTI